MALLAYFAKLCEHNILDYNTRGPLKSGKHNLYLYEYRELDGISRNSFPVFNSPPPGIISYMLNRVPIRLWQQAPPPPPSEA